MKKRALLVDGSAEARGFFSTINLLLLTLYYCAENDIVPIISSSVLSLYGSRPKDVRPFSEFFGDVFIGEKGDMENVENIDIAYVHNNNLFNFEHPSVIEQLAVINRALLDNLTDEAKNFINIQPTGEYFKSSISVHFRGCDYLKNTPSNHTPNRSPSEFLATINYFIAGAPIFVATDDDTFIDLVLSRGLHVSHFRDVYRRGPGRGVHMKSFFQKINILNSHKQYRKGLEVFRDVYWLSKSNTYIGSNSNLMYYSRLLNPNQRLINVTEKA